MTTDTDSFYLVHLDEAHNWQVIAVGRTRKEVTYAIMRDGHLQAYTGYFYAVQNAYGELSTYANAFAGNRKAFQANVMAFKLECDGTTLIEDRDHYLAESTIDTSQRCG